MSGQLSDLQPDSTGSVVVQSASFPEPVAVSVGGKYNPREDRTKFEGKYDRWAVGFLPESRMSELQSTYSDTVNSIRKDEDQLKGPISVIGALSDVVQSQTALGSLGDRPSISFVQGDKLVKVGYPYGRSETDGRGSVALIGTTITRLDDTSQFTQEGSNRFDAAQFRRILSNYKPTDKDFGGSTASKLPFLREVLNSTRVHRPQGLISLRDRLSQPSSAGAWGYRRAPYGEYEEFLIEYLPNDPVDTTQDPLVRMIDGRRPIEVPQTGLPGAVNTAHNLLTTLLQNGCVAAKIDLPTQDGYTVDVEQISQDGRYRISATDYRTSGSQISSAVSHLLPG
ncbi:hypothetical protein I204_05398 [Kwoniella mangroviensis CBS 8886]|nr:hypothetical protein I204_05398 [Kwoniella mangroviensis CBS 8886]